MKILVTGAAGFIGYHLIESLLKDGHEIIGLDNFNSYYDVNLKRARINNINHTQFSLVEIDLVDKKNLISLFEKNDFDVVVNLAAQAGVRYSLTNPEKYIESNIIGFTNILEACRHNEIANLVYASSSSVYGMNFDVPFDEDHSVDHPVSLYAATKRSNELMAHTYSHLFNLPTTGLRFFTVYGPWGRPDMALFLFTKAILDGEPIQVFNDGKMIRDFTYIDDIVSGIFGLTLKVSKEKTPYNVFNIGNGSPKKLIDYLKQIEKNLQKKAKIKKLPLQIGDIIKTHSDIDKLKKFTNYKPKTKIYSGIKNFIQWYKKYYKVT